MPATDANQPPVGIIDGLIDAFANRVPPIFLSEAEAKQLYNSTRSQFKAQDKPILSTQDGQATLSSAFMSALFRAGERGTGPGGYGAPPPPPRDTDDETTNTTGDGGTRINHAAYRASFQNYVAQLGIPPGQVSDLIAQGAQQGWTMDQFQTRLRQTQAYRNEFPGIQGPGGTMQMSEAQYMANAQQYKDVAMTHGINLSRQKMGYLFQNDVSPSEFSQKAGAFASLRDNPLMFNQFRAELIRSGVKPAQITKKKLYNTVMGQGDAEWYRVWNMTVARYAVRDAGLKIAMGGGGYGSLPRALIQRIAKKGFDQASLMSGFQQVADELISGVGTMSEARKFGVTKKDIVAATFGGPGSATARRDIEQARATNEAFERGPRANQQFGADEEGEHHLIGGKKQVQQGY